MAFNIYEQIKKHEKKEHKIIIVLIIVLVFAIGLISCVVSSNINEQHRLEREIASLTQIESLEVVYIGSIADNDAKSNPDNYIVTALYNNGERKKLTDFDFSRDGDIVTVKKDTAHVTITLGSKPSAPIGDDNGSDDIADNIIWGVIDESKNKENSSSKPVKPASSKTNDDGSSANDVSSEISSNLSSSSSSEASGGGNGNSGGYYPSPPPPKILVTSVTVITPPDKLVYLQGDFFDTTGLSIEVSFSNNTKKTIENITLEENKLMPYNDKVAIGYKGEHNTMYCYIEITVNPRTPTAITILTPPAKTEYIEGTKFMPSGLEVKIDFDNGDVEPMKTQNGYEPRIALYAYSTEDLIKGQSEIKIFFIENDVEVFAMQPINVLQRTPTGMRITAPPVKTEYIEDTPFDNSGMIVAVDFNNGKTENVSDYKYKKTDFTYGENEIEIKYSENGADFSCSQSISVIKKTPTDLLIAEPPDKTTYIEETVFIPDGMKIEAKYDNGKTYPIVGYAYSTDELALGTDAVKLEYSENGGDVSVNQPISVINRTPIALNVVTPPVKTAYIEDTKFNPSGLSLSVKYDNGKVYPAKTFAFDDTDFIFGDTKKEISYEENNQPVSTEISVTVVKKTPKELLIKQPPSKTRYIEETVFSPDGMIVEALYDNDKTYPVEGYTYTADELAYGTNKVTINYTENKKPVSTNQSVTVIKKSPTDLYALGTPVKQIEELPFKADGISFEADYDNGKRYTVSFDSVTYSKEPLTRGLTNLVCIYEENNVFVEATISFDVAKRTPTAIKITKLPDKVTYSAGQKFRPAGMVVEAEYDNGKKAVVTNYTWDDVQLYEGQTSVEIRYSEEEAPIAIVTALNFPKRVVPQFARYEAYEYIREECLTCSGSGTVSEKSKCNSCRGKGYTGHRGKCDFEPCIDGVINIYECSDGCYVAVGEPEPRACTFGIGKQVSHKEKCYRCDGTNYMDTLKNCSSCGGDGIFERHFTCKVCDMSGFSGHKLGKKIKDVVAKDKALPINGIGRDGNWYIKVGTIESTQPDKPSKSVSTAKFFKAQAIKPYHQIIKAAGLTANSKSNIKTPVPVDVGVQQAIYEKFSCVPDTCEDCVGTGKTEIKNSCSYCGGKGQATVCPSCNGTGTEMYGNNYPSGHVCSICGGTSNHGHWRDCTTCRRSGSVAPYTCNRCGGKGYTSGGMKTCVKCSGSGNFGYKADSKLSEITADKGSLPTDGRHTDGYWYVFKENVEE